jgi:hypothetical protein
MLTKMNFAASTGKVHFRLLRFTMVTNRDCAKLQMASKCALIIKASSYKNF